MQHELSYNFASKHHQKNKQKQNAKTDLWLCNLCKAVKTKH